MAKVTLIESSNAALEKFINKELTPHGAPILGRNFVLFAENGEFFSITVNTFDDAGVLSIMDVQGRKYVFRKENEMSATEQKETKRKGMFRLW